MEKKINFIYEGTFHLKNEISYSNWITRVLKSEGRTYGCINFIFCTDEELWKKNKQFLNHDTLTDIITFDYSAENEISGDIFISYERVKDNAKIFGVEECTEFKRVIIHGVLHLLKFDDKTEEEKNLMRKLEDQKIDMFHVEH